MDFKNKGDFKSAGDFKNKDVKSGLLPKTRFNTFKAAFPIFGCKVTLRMASFLVSA
jgi:hypothetical protein